MASCLRSIKYSIPRRRLSSITKSLSALQIGNLNIEGGTSCSLGQCGVNNKQFVTVLGSVDTTSSSNDVLSLNEDLAVATTSEVTTKSNKTHLSRSTSHPVFSLSDDSYKDESERESDCGNSIRIFKLPPNSLWYPPGAKHCGPNIYYSIAYSPLEQEVLDETLESLPSDVSHTEYSCANMSNIFPSNLESFPIPPSQRVYDISTILKNKDLIEESLHMCSTTTTTGGSSKDNSNNPGLPTATQLKYIKDTLADTLPSLFVKPMNYKIYEMDLVFENRIRGTITYGLPSYIKQTLLLRTIGHLKFATVKFEILGITEHPEEGTICMRWRIIGISGLRLIFTFWKVNINHWKKTVGHSDSWYDGFSTFYVNSNGLIYKHVADCVTPDRQTEKSESKTIPAALAALLGLRASLDNSTDIGFDTSTLLTQIENEDDFFSQLMLPLEKMT